MAAAVAEATAGLARLVHMPKGMMLTMGLLSMMLAAGWLLVMTRLTGITISALGVEPKLHINCAELHTCMAMILDSSVEHFVTDRMSHETRCSSVGIHHSGEAR